MSSLTTSNATGYSTGVHKGWAIHPHQGHLRAACYPAYDLKHMMENGLKAQGMECFI